MTLDLAPDVDIEAELGKAEANETPPEPPVEPAETPETPEVQDEAPEVTDELPADAEPPKKGAQKTVPLAALHAVRNENKQFREQMRLQKEEHARALAQLEERVKAFEAPPPEKPTFEADPANYLKSDVDSLKKTQAEMVQASQRQQLQEAINARFNASEMAFAAKQADYKDAAMHLKKVVEQNVEHFGVAPEARPQAVYNEINRIVISALQNGKDPAEMVYALSKTYGYAAKKPTPKLETIAKGQEASQSLGSGGKSESGGLSLDAIARMDDDDFTALVQDDKKWKQIANLLH